MAAGVKKLTIGGEHTAEQAVGYLADPQARGDYYSEGGAALMFWLATPRSRTYFGLGQWVSRAKLTALLNGLHPVDGQLIRQPGPDGTMVGGIDVTVSPAPKSVSALWALADDDLRRELETLVILAAHRAVGRMLAEVALVRERYGPGPGDVRRVPAADWVGVEVLHTTARLSAHKGVPDPQLHVHNVLIGALDYAGRLRALDSRQILLYRSELDAEASSALAEELRQRGFTIRRELVRGPSGAVKRVAWEIEGVPEDLLRAMSSRRREVEDLRQRYCEKTAGRPRGLAGNASWSSIADRRRS